MPEHGRLLTLGEDSDGAAIGERFGKLAAGVLLGFVRALAEPGVDFAESRKDGAVAGAEGSRGLDET